MAVRNSSYLQGGEFESDRFRSGVNNARYRSMLAAFNALEGSSPTDAVIQRAFQDGGDDAQAFQQGASMATGGLNQLQDMGSAFSGLEAKYASTGLGRAATAASRAEELRTAEEVYKNMKEAADNQKSGGFLGSALGFAGTIASIFCERRLKTDIAPLDATRAWAVVRDLPLYSFRYRHDPTIPAYGPMVDELEHLDPSLLVPMDQQAAALGIGDGQPVRGVDRGRWQIYESAALQQALQRIEALEARLAQLESLTPLSARHAPLALVPSVPLAA